jgi:LysR family transcriptional regulator, low CO2-responsive transcriptional regulator
VVAGLGNSIMPLIGIMNEILSGDLCIEQAKDLPITTKWRLIWLKGKRLSPVAQAYLDYVRANKERILKEHFDWYLKFESSGKRQ